MPLYKVTRYVKEVYFVESSSKERALRDATEYGDPVIVKIVKETAVKHIEKLKRKE